MRHRCVIAALLTTAPALGQSFADGAAQIPPVGPGNNSTSENVDLADVDLDGDFDAVWADGGDDGNDRNRLWINQGGAQGGTVGFFVDQTLAQYPAITDTSRDVDFADIDGDGDPDLVVSNVSSQSNQSNRILVNQGGLQGGTAGFFVDESSTRWVNVGINDGSTTFSSVAPAFALLSGGFIDWSCDTVFGDLDADGDLDMVHSSYGIPVGGSFSGNIPHRLFLNDGLGHFEEHNPSGFQLASVGILNGDPALWASGVQVQSTMSTNGFQSDIATTAIGIEIGDLDGDFDLDLLLGAREEQPRLFRNELAGGVLAPFLDVTFDAFSVPAISPNNYEQELGDLDNDDDLDIYGVNWGGSFSLGQLSDAVLRNDGTFNFGPLEIVPGSEDDEEEAEYLDYDADGDLDVFVANFSGQDKLYQNQGAPGYALVDVTDTELPTSTDIGRGADAADVDLDGDLDVFVANSNFKANKLLLNVTEVPDTHAPRVVVEQVSGPACGQATVAVRARVFDNASWEWQRYDGVQLEYAVDGGAQQTVPMRYAGGQLWRGEIPAGTVGSVAYRVRATDPSGNAGVSPVRNYVAAPASVSYCTAGTSASGCQALLSSTGTPSATAASGFVVQADDVEGSKQALYYWGTNGRQANPWGNGTSWRCVQLPVFRSAPLVSSGASGTCDGTVAYDLTARWQQKPNSNPGPGALTQLQLWYRDPQSTSNQTTSLSDALEFTTCP